MNNRGMFDPLPNGRKAASAKPPPAASGWLVIMPVPPNVPAPPTAHPKLGKPTASWEYSDAGGQLLGIVCRFDLAGGGKEIRCLAFAEHKKYGRQWRWLGFPKPRPLYGLDQLAARPDAPVILCEGEKAADAAGQLLPDHVAVTSLGGSKAAKATDWSPLAGRNVVIWPDADETGQAYAHDVLDMLAKLSPAPALAIVKPPEGVPEGWDAADALADRWDTPRTAALVASAQLVAAASQRKPAVRDALSAAIEEIVELWHCPQRNAYATVLKDGHWENHAVLSRDFRGWLSWRVFEMAGLAPSGTALDDACRLAEAIALNRGACHHAWLRIAEQDGRIYVDHGCQRWRVTVISANGWETINRAALDIKIRAIARHGAAPRTGSR
jgi:putative DNA primase/helicase